jgi:nucleoside-diphosphate-sugar epimerase
MHATVIGGTGQLGHFVIKHLENLGFTTTAVGLGKLPEPGYLPTGTKVLLKDTSNCTQLELQELISGSDVIIHAAGADGRALFDAPAIDGFRAANVQPIKSLIAAMKETGAIRLVILGSYYTAMHRLFPKLNIPAKSAYVLSRLEQANIAFQEAGSQIDVAILELPYIFGAAPGRGTLWDFYIQTLLNTKDEVPVHMGGSACVTMNQIGIATANASLHSTGKCFIPIGNENFTYQEIFEMFAKALGVQCSIVPKPIDYFLEKARQQKAQLQEKGKESAYDPVGLLYMEELNFFIDPAPAMHMLKYEAEDIATAIEETVKATLTFKGTGPGSLNISK